MSSEQKWTIKTICDALGDSDLVQRFIAELNHAPAHELLHTFAKWQRIAENLEDAFSDADEITAHEARGETPPGTWIDGDERLHRAADRNHTRGAA